MGGFEEPRKEGLLKGDRRDSDKTGRETEAVPLSDVLKSDRALSALLFNTSTAIINSLLSPSFNVHSLHNFRKVLAVVQ